MLRHFVAGLLLLVIGIPAWAQSNWPVFRGLEAGIGDDGAPTTWSSTKNVVWKVDVPGRGWSSPIVWGDRIILTSVIRDGKEPDPRKGLYFGGNQFTPPKDMHRWLVYCFDWKTGKKVWEKVVNRGKPDKAVHIKNTYASETPVTDGERVYAYFGNIGLFCLDMNGKELWSKRWPAVKTRFSWGTAASPVLHGDRVFIINDNEEKSFLTALDKKTGKEIWKVERDEKSNWATPYVWEHKGRTELITSGTKRVRSYDLDGKLLWELEGMSVITIPTPFSRHGLLYLTSGYVLDRKRPIFAVKPGAQGNITPRDGKGNQFIAWHKPVGGPYNTTPLVYGDYMYVLYDRGFLACFDARTGKEVYDRQRLAGGFTASPWAADGKIFCLNEDGDTFVVAAGPKFQRLERNQLEEMCMATPAVLRGSVLIRTMSKLYRIGESKAD